MRRLIPTLLAATAACTAEAEPVLETITAAPLRARADGADTRFVRLDPSHSGLHFVNQLRDENNLPYIYSGAGLAVGDYDGDGLPDVYLVSQDGANKLFRQTAPMQFEDVTERAGGLGGGDRWGTAATFVDIDGDGDLDLYVCNLEAPNLLYQNRGDGTFVEVAGKLGLAIVAASMGAAFADYDNDGDLDLYLLTNRVLGPRLPQEIVDAVRLPSDTQKTLSQLFPPHPKFDHADGQPVVPKGYEDFVAIDHGHVVPAGQPDRLFRNDGYANWRDVSRAAGIQDQGQGLSVTWFDFDDDGWLDIFVANDLESPDALYRNRGDGTFEDVTSQRLAHTAYFGMGSDFGDIDNDGRFDFCVADMSSTTHYMGKMLMGDMSDRRWFLIESDPQQYMRNAVHLNTGTTRFLEVAHMAGLASTDWTWTVRFADLDEDGWLDFYATNGLPRFHDDPDLGMEFSRLWRLGEREAALALVREVDEVAERNIARRNLGAEPGGHLKFADVGAAWGLDEAGVSHGAVLVDFDRDGDLDVLVNNLNAPASLFENRTVGTSRILLSLRSASPGNAFGLGARIVVEAGGIRQSRIMSSTRGYMSAGEAVEHFGLGMAQRIDRLHVTWPSGRRQEFTELEVDRHYTIRESLDDKVGPRGVDAATVPAAATMFEGRDATFAAMRHVEREFDDYAVQPLLPHQLSRLGPGLAVGDVDGDGHDDVWVGGAAGQAGALFVADGAGAFARVAGPWTDDAECEDMGAVWFDFDSDGDLDLYVVSGGVEATHRPELLRDRLYMNRGDGTFEAAPAQTLAQANTAFSGSHVCAVDFDKDGDLDLFVGARVVPGRFPTAPGSVLLRNDGGALIDVTAEVCASLDDAGMVTGAVWTDVNADTWPDLVVVAQWQPVRIFMNTDRGAAFRDVTAAHDLDALRGQWNSIAAGDFDGDGDEDLVVGNLGLNTKYKADPGRPLRLYGADFDGNGSFDVVEAKHQGETLLPVRGRSCSSDAMPFLAQRFRTYDSFARASLREIYGDEALQGASIELSCNELRSVLLENRGGKFFAHPLPRIAQVAPGFGLGVADFDGDGALDVALAHNFYSPEPETGRFAGGLGAILRGDGALGFESVPAATSGVSIPEDGKALALLDLDGDALPDIVVACNDGPLRVYRNAASARPGSIAVRLVGPVGNPTGVGARVALQRPDGVVAVRVVRAGDGYLTQSAAVVWFAAPKAGSVLRVEWPDGETYETTLDETSVGQLTVTR